MERKMRLLRGAFQTLIAALIAGCCAYACACAAGFESSWPAVYLAAGLSALAVCTGGRSLGYRLGAAAAALGACTLILLRHSASMAAALSAVAENGVLSGELSQIHAVGGRSFALLAAIFLGTLFGVLLKSPTGTFFVLTILVASIICALALNGALTLWIAVPGLIAGLAVFALPFEGRFDGLRLSALAVSAALVLIALLFVPSQRTTWAPLENLANAVRSVVEDYVRFTEQRVAFSINEKGYDRAGMISESVVAMLGGPADPDDAPVMRVETEGELLLRGTIKRSYTGYSWVDDQSKARYLYYDFTHRRVRESVFGADLNVDATAFESVRAKLTMLSEGTSTLFVPAHMSDFSMQLADAVYYNSIGEIFLTRDVQAGDSYELLAYRPLDDNALMRAAADGQLLSDAQYAQMLAEYTQLPSGIDENVYALAIELTKNDANPAAKALAIQNYLVQNYTYTLDGGYPENGRDFVSWFLNESKAGYCSYFASAMTVLSRIAGLPARYVEGYYVQNGQEVLTGENAHAWVEIYLNGIGWTAFDPTARAMNAQGDLAQQGGDAETQGDDESHTGSLPDNTPTPSPAPDNGETAPTPSPEPEDGSAPTSQPNAAQDNTPTPSPQPQTDENPFADSNDSDSSAPPSGNSNEPNKKSRKGLWIALSIVLFLLLIALAVLLLRRRLRATDPLLLCSQTRSAQTAALILYRGILTLLAQAGQLPMSGETPAQFASRAVKALPNAHYEAFVAGVVAGRYSGKGVSRQTIALGRKAYTVFLNAMGRGERIRYYARRILHGIGSLEMIP